MMPGQAGTSLAEGCVDRAKTRIEHDKFFGNVGLDCVQYGKQRRLPLEPTSWNQGCCSQRLTALPPSPSGSLSDNMLARVYTHSAMHIPVCLSGFQHA